MNRASILAFGITMAVLAAATWSETTLTADDEAATPLRVLRADGVTITAEVRDLPVEGEGRLMSHLFVVASGTGCGTISLAMRESGGNPLSRIPNEISVAWEKSIPYDLSGGTQEVDLGPLPNSQTKSEPRSQNPFRGTNELAASVDGKSWVTLWGDKPSLEALTDGIRNNPSIQKLIERVREQNPTTPVKADE